jgi:2-oxoglutarate/2-oxoacid ferredoxin oxidoreductase subunit beta
MSYIAKPKVAHPQLPKNTLGFTVRDYEGAMSTLCAGCGHDSITGAIIQAAFEQSIPPHRLAKLSGIGCSSKTPAYFASASHGINTVHGRMPAVATGANAANPELYYLGVSGDGDSLSIGLGQFLHAVRRNLNMVYILENNGVYGLTKGQFSASADIGSKAKKGETNQQPPIDPVQTLVSLGATFVARSFSGDKEQLVPLIRAALAHRGFAFIDVISPCVTFNDHEGSTKSYTFTRKHAHVAQYADFVPPAKEIRAPPTRPPPSPTSRRPRRPARSPRACCTSARTGPTCTRSPTRRPSRWRRCPGRRSARAPRPSGRSRTAFARRLSGTVPAVPDQDTCADLDSGSGC